MAFIGSLELTSWIRRCINKNVYKSRRRIYSRRQRAC
nr:MAG TPA: hypothetical protein [Crassvirales sp.]